MMNRNKSELERARRYHNPDAEDLAKEDSLPDRVPWFGLQLKTRTVHLVGFGLTGLMIALVCVRWWFADDIPGLPYDTIWFTILFLAAMLVMSYIAISMFRAATNAYRQEIREMDARTAREDNATEEEVEEYVRQSDKKLGRKVLRRNLYFLAAGVVLFPTLGTELIFPWGGVVYFILGMVAFVAVSVVWWYYRYDLANKLRRPFGSREPRGW